MHVLRRLAPVLILSLLGACAGGGGSTPTSPTPDVLTLQLSGRVVDASAGTALQGVVLSAVDGPNAGKSTTSGADGRYTLGNLVSGGFTFRAQRDGYEDYSQSVTITSNTTIELRMIPGRSLSSGWTGGQFFANVDGAQVGARVTTAQVSQSASTLNGSFTGADGSTGTFTGQVAGGRFTGTLRAELVFNNPSTRCRGTAANTTGTASPSEISLTAASLTFENCSRTATNVTLVLTP